MYKVVKKSRAVQSFIILAALFVMFTIFPLRMWKENIPSASNQILAGSSDSICEDYMLQRFIAQYDHLGTINLYVVDFENGWNRDERVDSFIFRMLDSDMEIMFEEKIDMRFCDIPGFCTVYINEEVEVGRDYYFFLQGMNGSRVWFGLEETENAGTPYVSRLIYNYDELEGYNIIGEYNYTVPLRKEKVFLYDAILLAAAILLTGAVEEYYRTIGKDKLITVEKALRFAANCLAGAALAYAVWNISIRRFFSGKLMDNIFYTVGILFGFSVLFYIINVKRDRQSFIPFVKKFASRWQNILQTIFIAAGVWACCNYMNGLYDIHHRVAERQFIVFLALAAIVMCEKKEIFNKLTIVYALAALGITLWYRSIYVDYLAMDEWDLRILRWGIAAVVLSGFLLVNILAQLVRIFLEKKKITAISWWYGAVLALFFVLIIVFRNTRWWTVTLAAAFTLFYIRYALWDKKAYLLQNICNGLLLNFVVAMMFSFARRPFLSWVYPRFPFIFHTVTVTAVYMTFIMCAALIRLTDRYKECFCVEKADRPKGMEALRCIWKELLLFGMSGTYMLFTASRTGFLAVAVMGVVTLIFLAMDARAEKLKHIVMLVGMMVCGIVWCFPWIFTAQRVVPALYGNIFKYEVEVFPDAITRGDEWDSMYYITIERFAEVFNNKIFGIPEKGSSSYERSEEYQKYRAKRYNNKGEVVWEGSIDELYEEDSAETAEGMEGAAGEDTASGGERSSGRELNIIGTKTEEERQAEEEEAARREAEAKSSKPEEEKEPEEETIEDMSVYEKTEEYANGRMDIFRAYIGALNLEGHDEMGAVLPDGELAVHAHNIYLQVAYDHGIVVGAMFLLVGAASFVQGCIFYKKRRDRIPCAALPAAAIAAFAMAGLVEWIFHLCHPAGFTLMLVLAPLLFDMGEKKDKANEKR